jgi:predicted regulator of Ras-like GTPase activity (Roadblock/LC7/MglB family)
MRAEGGDPGAVVSADGELVASLPTHDELHITDEVAAQLVSMSAATIDRRLAPAIAEVSVVGVDDTVILVRASVSAGPHEPATIIAMAAPTAQVIARITPRRSRFLTCAGNRTAHAGHRAPAMPPP